MPLLKTKKEIIIPKPDREKLLVPAIYGKKLDQMEKKYSLTSQELYIPNKLSSGLLCMDTLTSGGIAAGCMYQVSGLEKGAKTTYSSTVLGNAVRKNVPIVLDWDAENAMSDPDYAKACMGFTPSEIFFGKNKRARLYQESVLEDFYNSTRSIMRTVPDKFYKSDAKQWFFVFDADADGRAMMAEWGYTSYNKQFYQDTGRLWCETDSAGLQGLVICDSYPALVVSKIDDNEEEKILPALNARAFSDNIRKVRGVMKRKGFAIQGVNQIRVNPMPKYGQNPEYEPGGNALAFYSDCRLQNRPTGVPDFMFEGIGASGNKTKAFGQEPSVYGVGTDKYNYINVTNTKNKLGLPGLNVKMRVWFKDGKGDPHGYDIAFDTFQYLKMTGRIEGSPKKQIKINLPEMEKWPKLTWGEFKILTLAHTDKDIMKIAKDTFENMKSIPDLRPQLFKEIRTKATYKMLSDDARPKATEDMEAV